MVSKAQAYWMHRRKNRMPVHQVLAAELADIAGDVNVRGKLKGKLVMDLDNSVTYAALGSAAGDAWRPVGTFDNSRDVTPV
ncbi:hypothetical protein N8D56_21300 [Devosia sp. A8/3-2]|nr:hypothetical protein N8D56_21300 [Devosia sp. A8/3-2]